MRSVEEGLNLQRYEDSTTAPLDSQLCRQQRFEEWLQKSKQHAEEKNVPISVQSENGELYIPTRVATAICMHSLELFGNSFRVSRDEMTKLLDLLRKNSIISFEIQKSRNGKINYFLTEESLPIAVAIAQEYWEQRISEAIPGPRGKESLIARQIPGVVRNVVQKGYEKSELVNNEALSNLEERIIAGNPMMQQKSPRNQ